MTIQVNLGSRKRKVLATAVGGILNAKVSYKGPPTYEFKVGKVIIGRDGTVSLNSKHDKDAATANRLLEGLSERGFEPFLIEEANDQATGEPSNEVVIPKEEDEDDLPFGEEYDADIVLEPPDKQVIKIPLDGFDEASIQNLRLLVDSKALLIKKSMEVATTPIVKTNTTIDFPWFERMLLPDEITAYSNFIKALCDMAKRQKRVIAVEKPTDNEKFTFRLFLVRLGLIGDEYADTRRILLKNLPGNGSWKDLEGKSTNPRNNGQSPELKAKEDILPSFIGTDDAETAMQKVSFIKRLGYFLLHFDE